MLENFNMIMYFKQVINWLTDLHIDCLIKIKNN